MQPLTSAREVREFLTDQREGYRGFRGELERRIAVDVGYYHGMQFASVKPRPSRNNALARLETDWNPDSNKLRVTTNRVARFIQKAAVATHPEKIEAEVCPPDREPGAEPVVNAQVLEDALAIAIDASGYSGARANANFNRCICGSYGIGLSLRMGQRAVTMAGKDLMLPDSAVRAFEFEPTRLTLDPADTTRTLEEREWMIYSDVWASSKVRSFFGIKPDDKRFREDQLSTVGDLAPFQLAINRLSENLLFAQFRTHSKTKGAVVHQIHTKDDAGLWSMMYVLIEVPDKEPWWMNEDDPGSPYGGSGLPFGLIHGHRRMDTGAVGLSDAAMLKDDQDRLNLSETYKFRVLQKHAGWHWVIDRNSIGRESSEQKFREQVSNAVGSAIFYDSGTRERPGQKPEMVKYPGLEASMGEMIGQYEEAMQNQVHRAEGNFGVTKSHVPAQTFTAAVEQSDQIFAARVSEDIVADSRLLRVLLGTTIKQIQAMSPTVLGMLRRANFGAEELSILYDSDPVHITSKIEVRESSVRFRSYAAKRQDLDSALQNKAISGQQWREALARDLDAAVSQDDRFFSTKADKSALAVLTGMDWSPVPLGEYTSMFLNAFRRAALDPRADPAARQRLAVAIQSQQLAFAQEQQVMNPQPQAQGGGALGVGAGGGSQPDEADGSMDAMMQSLQAQTSSPAMAGVAA